MKPVKNAYTNQTNKKANCVTSLRSSPLSPGNRCRIYIRASTAPPAMRTLSPSNSSHDGTLLTIQRLTSQTPPEHRAGNPRRQIQNQAGRGYAAGLSTLGTCPRRDPTSSTFLTTNFVRD